MSSSSPAELRAWRRERFQLRRFGPLALVLALAASAGAGRPRMERLGRDALLALLLLLQFRLWDDLADLPRDRVDHPARVLCRAATHGPFRAAMVGFAGASALLLARSPGHRQPPAPAGLLGFAALNAGLFAWYVGPGRRHSGTALGAHIVILKYPAFVALLRGSDRPAGAAFALACAGVYLALCAHESLDDERLRGARWLLWGEITALGAVLALCARELHDDRRPRGPRELLIGRTRPGRSSPPWTAGGGRSRRCRGRSSTTTSTRGTWHRAHEVRHLSRWWGPEGFTTTTRAFEFRVGGEWDFVMHGPDGTDYQEWISWTEISPPERIALLHGESRGDPNAFESVLTFAPDGAATRLEMRTVFRTKELRDQAVEKYHAIEGGQQTLSNLAAYVTGIGRKEIED